MDQPTPNRMLYRAPGPEKLHGVMVEYVIVDEDDTQTKLAEGWSLSPTEAAAALEAAQAPAKDEPETPADNAPPSRAELEAKAKELGLTFDGRTKDKKLGEMIAAALA